MGDTLTVVFLLEPMEAVAQVSHKNVRAQTKLDIATCPEGMSVRRRVVHGARLCATRPQEKKRETEESSKTKKHKGKTEKRQKIGARTKRKKLINMMKKQKELK